MNRLLVVLALVGAVPGGAQEACDMVQKPIAYPGAVLSRNAQIRAQALQGGAYASPDTGLLRLPTNYTEELLLQYGVPAGLPSPATFFARIKWDKRVDFNIQSIGARVGTNTSGLTKVFGFALYTASVENGVGTLRLVKGTAGPTANGAFIGNASVSWTEGYTLDRNQEYVGAFYGETGSIDQTEYYIQDVNVSTIMAALYDYTNAGTGWDQVIIPTPNGSRTFYSNKLIAVKAQRMGASSNMLDFY